MMIHGVRWDGRSIFKVRAYGEDDSEQLGPKKTEQSLATEAITFRDSVS